MPDQDRPGPGELERAGAAVDQRQADRAFEGGDVLADGGLGHPELARGQRERALRTDLAEHPDGADLAYQHH